MIETLRRIRRKASRWLIFSVVLVGLLIVAFGSSQAELLRLYLAKEGKVSDNQAWVISQLEVDYEKLKRSVAETERALAFADAALIPPKAWAQLLLAFDIYYSRISIVESQGAMLAATGDLPERYNRNAALLKTHRAALAETFDTVETPGRDTIEKIKEQLALVEIPVRRMAIDTLAVLSEKADFERSAIRRYFWLHAVASSLTVALLSAVAVTIYAMLQLARKQYLELDHSIETRKRILKQISRAFIFTDCEGAIVSSNRGVQKLFGWKEHEILEVKIWDVLLPEKRRQCGDTTTRAHWVQALKAGESVTIREIAMRKNGQRLPVEIVAMYLEVEDEKTYLFKIRSLVVEQRVTRALRRDRINAEKRAFRNFRLLSVMSHEMRTPLHAVIAALDLAQLQKPRPEARRLIQVAQDAAQTALTYADDALDLVQIESRPEIARESEFSPAVIVSEVVDMLRPTASRNANTILTVLEPDRDDIVIGKPDLMRHAISNLLSNAIKFTQNGKITVRLTRDTGAETFKLEVIDTGIGISQADQARIMSDAHDLSRARNSQTIWKGSGLGLGLFKRAVSVMGGAWGLESAPGEGSRFWFSFKARRPERKLLSRNENLLRSARHPPLSPNVLAVDDNMINLNLLGRMLGALGIPHKLVGSGAEAVQAAYESRFDIVLLDIGMPGLDGYQTASEIRKAGRSRGAVLIAFTADTTISENKEKLQQAGLNDILLKPVTIRGLQEKIDRHIKFDASAAQLQGATGTTAAGSVLDDDTVAHLVELGGLDSFLPLVDNLLAQAATLQESLHGTAERNTKALQAQFHELVGAAGMMGAALLSKTARDIQTALENQARVNDTDHAVFIDAVNATRAAFARIEAEAG